MTNLTDVILEQINDYEMESLVAESNVIKAHMEATMRDIMIQLECEEAGIIMESDDETESIIPLRRDENIIKYIFLFIPRLVINIFKKIKQAWQSHIKSVEEATIAKHREKEFSIAASAAQAMCDKANKAVHGPGYMAYTGSGFIFMTRLRDINSVCAVYETFQAKYINYKNIVLSFLEMTNGGKDINPKDTEYHIIAEIDASYPRLEDLCYSEPIGVIHEEGFLEAFKHIRQQISVSAKAATNAMNDVENAYKMTLVPEMSIDNKTLIKRYMDMVSKLNDVFIRFDDVVHNDFADAADAFMVKEAEMKVWRKNAIDNQKSDEARQDLEENLDKWGMK